MIPHDEYGKRLMGVVAGDAFVPDRTINYGGRLSDDDIKPKIDGVVGETVAVEIQAGWLKPGSGCHLGSHLQRRVPVEASASNRPSERLWVRC